VTAVLLVLVTPGQAAEEAVVCNDLHHGTWLLETPLGEASGPFLVARTPDGAFWRCEVALVEDGRWPSREDILRRRGRGWTITHTPDGSFAQPWNEPWQELGGATARSLGQLIDRWRGVDLREFATWSYPRRWRPREPWQPRPVVLDDWGGLPASWRPPGEGPDTVGHLRRRLVTRGLGRGGEGLVLELRWDQAALVATTARWPGRLSLNRTGSEPAALPAEAYLPLWPLAQFLP
jgi:hypothetical protein